MVDFSNRDDIKRWLDAIEPPERRREVAVAMAARAALRVVPLLGRELTRSRLTRGEVLSAIVLPCLRAAAAPWVASKYPSYGGELRAAAAAADNAALAAAFAVAATDAAVRAAASSAAAACGAASGASDAAAALAAADGNAAEAAAYAHGFAAYAEAIAADAALIDSGRSGAELAGMPLWPNGAPDWASEAWRGLKSALLDANEGWEVWTDWYEARLAGDAGRPPIEALEVARATIPDEIWKQGPAVANAEIKRLIAEYKPGTQEVEDTNSDVATNDDPDQDQADFAPILATRATLRVLPLLATDEDRLVDTARSKFVLSVFRALAVAWARTQYPTLVDSRWSVAAARDIRAYGPLSRPAAQYVGRAAVEAAFAAGNVGPKVAAKRASSALFQVRKATRALERHDASEVIIEQANSSDKGDVVPGVRPDQIAQVELWPGRDPPQFIGEQWEALKEGLRFANEGWDVWIDWYEARLDGRLRSQEVELAYVQFIRNVSPTASAWEANSEIKRLIDLHAPKPETPTPATEPGPILEVGEKGLALAAPTPLGEFDPAVQSALHERLKRLCPDLLEATRRVGNTHPGLMAVVSEYADLVAQPLASLDVTSLWAVGAGLLANREAFARLPQAGGMSEPLEPNHLALLQQVAEIHGAFILGFPRGRELTDRADHSRLTPEILAAILPAARDLLDRWRLAKTMVEERTRKFFDAIENAAMGPSWQTARAGYSVYAVTRNALIGVGKLMLRANSLAATVVGAAVVGAIDPNLAEQTRLWVSFVLDQSQTILSFSEPFPELKVWLASIIDVLERDKAFRGR
ncbi:MAG: hypothetical protein ABSC25_02945 [Roseiarcus sp.]|jgi:hypothetical protein